MSKFKVTAASHDKTKSLFECLGVSVQRAEFISEKLVEAGLKSNGVTSRLIELASEITDDPSEYALIMYTIGAEIESGK